MYADIVFNHKLGADGFRFDALKHVKSGFFLDWLHHLRRRAGRNLFAVGEYWSGERAALESVVEPWFKPLAYALILLRRDGYPCVFTADYYGAEYEDYGSDGRKHRIRMETASPNATYIDLTEHVAEPAVTDDEGRAEFRCNAGSVSVRVPR